MKQREITFTDADLKECYDARLTLAATAVKLKSTTVSVWRRAKAIGLAWKDLPRTEDCGIKIPLESILNGEHPDYQTFKLHNRLLSEGIKEHRCECCGNTEWNGKPIPLQLDHIDGDSHNHVLSNLRMLCPNCHAQTDTYCGKNKRG